MAAKPPLLHDRTENAFMQKQFSSHNSSLTIHLLFNRDELITFKHN